MTNALKSLTTQTYLRRSLQSLWLAFLLLIASVLVYLAWPSEWAGRLEAGWFALLTLAAAATLYWLFGMVARSACGRDRAQFGTKTLLGSVALTALMILPVCRVRDLGRQATAICRIRANGGRIRGHNSKIHVDLGGLSFLDLDPWEIYTTVDVDNDAALLGLTRFSGAFSHLERLNVNRDVTDAGVATLVAEDFPRMGQMSVRTAHVTSRGLQHLATFHRVNFLHLRECYALEDGCLIGFEHVQCLDLTGDDGKDEDRLQLTNDSMQHIAEMTELRWLEITGCPLVTDAGLVHLRQCKKLERLRLRNTSVTQSGIRTLREALPHCEVVDDPAAW